MAIGGAADSRLTARQSATANLSWAGQLSASVRQAARVVQVGALHWLGTTCWACEARLAVGDAGPWCAGCAVAVENGSIHTLSGAGADDLDQPHGADLPVAALWTYAGAVAEALGQAKARSRALPMGVMAAPWSRLVRQAQRSCGAAAVCAVPPHRQRLAERGWSLPDQLAQASAAEVVWPLERLDALAPRRVDRQAAPRLRSSAAPANAPAVLLIDDVITSGATLRACQAALEGQGWRVTGAAVLADARPAAIAEVLGRGDGPR